MDERTYFKNPTTIKIYFIEMHRNIIFFKLINFLLPLNLFNSYFIYIFRLCNTSYSSPPYIAYFSIFLEISLLKFIIAAKFDTLTNRFRTPRPS